MPSGFPKTLGLSRWGLRTSLGGPATTWSASAPEKSPSWLHSATQAGSGPLWHLPGGTCKGKKESKEARWWPGL